MAKVITAPPKRVGGGRPMKLPELEEVQNILDAQDESTPENERWIQLDRSCDNDKPWVIQSHVKNYRGVLSEKFGVEVTTRCYTDPLNGDLHRAALAFARDDEDKFIPLGEGDSDDGEPQEVATD